jgi:hypothetical protein
MKKWLVAIIFAFILLNMPVISAFQNTNTVKINNEVNIYVPFKIKLTNETIEELNEIINQITDMQERQKAELLIDQVLSDDGELNIDRFGSILNDYDINEIYNSENTKEFIDDVINFLLYQIKGRLGWVYQLLDITSNIVNDTNRLINDRNLPMEIINEVNNLIIKIKELQNLTTLLNNKQYLKFLRLWSPGILIQDIISIVESIIIISTDLGILIGDLRNFINDVQYFISWFSSNPWSGQIHIYGYVMELTNGVANATVTCRDQSGITDEEGYFDFYVNSTPDSNSIPDNEQYGMHLCVLQAEKDGVVKNTKEYLSYVFSNGEFYWIFQISFDDSDEIDEDNDFDLNHLSIDHNFVKSYLYRILNIIYNVKIMLNKMIN